jgi:hypothetical protein
VLPLAHLGFGPLIVRPWIKQLPYRWVLVGTLLPDIIDKPIYLADRLTHWGWMLGTRGPAHTLIALGVAAAWVFPTKSDIGRALWWGALTHFVLDVASKAFAGELGLSGALEVMVWPYYSWGFPKLPHGVEGMSAVVTELCGAATLAIRWRKDRHPTRVRPRKN